MNPTPPADPSDPAASASGRFTPALKPMLPRRVYVAHLVEAFTLGSLLIACSLALGTIGYRHLEHLRWIDAVYSASMILTDMGPATPPATSGGKLFATCYALYSGVVFLSAVALMITPVFRRIVHRLHLDMHEQGDNQTPQAPPN